MKKDEIAVFIFDPEKKEQFTRITYDKLIKEIKVNLSKNKPVLVTLSEYAE